jgi:phage major head subunit gpT-like protein
MIISQPNLQLFFTAFETRFWTALGATPLVYGKIATTFPVGTEQWVSGWIGMLDKAREWIGPRVTHTPAPQTYLVPMQLFELTEGIDQFRLEDDTYGIYNPVVDFMGIQMAKWPDYQIRDMIQNQGSQTGARQLSLDGLTHWNTAHLVDFWDASKGTYPNDYTNGGVTINSLLVGGALAANSFATVWEDMARRKTESGEPWGIIANMAMTGPMLKLAMDTILQAQFMGLPVIGSIGTASVNPNPPTAGMPANAPLVGATENMMKGWTDRIMWPELGGSTAIGGGTMDSVWYVMDTSKPVRPFSWLLRSAPDFTYRIRPDDPVVFDTHTYQYGSKARGTPAWSFPQLASRSGP